MKEISKVLKLFSRKIFLTKIQNLHRDPSKNSSASRLHIILFFQKPHPGEEYLKREE